MKSQSGVVGSSEVALITLQLAILFVHYDVVFFEALLHAKCLTTGIADKRLLAFMDNEDVFVSPVLGSGKKKSIIAYLKTAYSRSCDQPNRAEDK